jgi:hypothetical protein
LNIRYNRNAETARAALLLKGALARWVVMESLTH